MYIQPRKGEKTEKWLTFHVDFLSPILVFFCSSMINKNLYVMEELILDETK